jgi:hypothetical protein
MQKAQTPESFEHNVVPVHFISGKKNPQTQRKMCKRLKTVHYRALWQKAFLV